MDWVIENCKLLVRQGNTFDYREASPHEAAIAIAAAVQRERERCAKVVNDARGTLETRIVGLEAMLVDAQAEIVALKALAPHRSQ